MKVYSFKIKFILTIGLLGLMPFSYANNKDEISLEQASETIRKQTSGKVLSATTKKYNGIKSHRIQVLTESGRVKIYKVPVEKVNANHSSRNTQNRYDYSDKYNSASQKNRSSMKDQKQTSQSKNYRKNTNNINRIKPKNQNSRTNKPGNTSTRNSNSKNSSSRNTSSRNTNSRNSNTRNSSSRSNNFRAPSSSKINNTPKF